MTPIEIAPGAPTDRSGRVVTLGKKYIERALSHCVNTEEERAYLAKALRSIQRSEKAAAKRSAELAAKREAARAANSASARKWARWRAEERRNTVVERRTAAALAFQEATFAVRRGVSLAEPKGHMAELADGWMPEWVKVPT